MAATSRRLAIILGTTLSAAAGLSACAPPTAYQTPRFPFAARYAGAEARPPVLLSNARWWTRMNDPVLNRLVARALSDNLSLAQARARTEAARAAAAAVLAATFSLDLKTTLTHVAVTVYLYLAAVVLAGFVAKNPIAHTRLIYAAWTFAAVVAAGAALAGYFGLLPGAAELFTKYGRASGTFKDPNVFGPFLVAPILYMAHVALERSWTRMLVPLAVAGFLALAVLLSFSRGAWMNLAAATAIYAIRVVGSVRCG